MLRIRCTNCQSVLDVDEAFAGGACRCKHCGTIQTVPSLKRQIAKGADAGTSSKTLYENKARVETSTGTGLDQLADIVASSGLGSGLTSNRLQAPENTQAGRQRIGLLVGAISIIILVLTVAIVVLFRSPERPKGTDKSPLQSGEPITRIPNFCGIKLDVPAVVYVLDRGNSSRDVLGAVKEATLKSVESLGRDRRFQIVFWHNGADDSFPAGSPIYATPENLIACRKWMEDITAFGQSDVRSAIKKAGASGAAAMLLLTPKGWELDQSFNNQLLAELGTTKMLIHTVAVGDSPSSTLKLLAEGTGGQYRTIDTAALREFAQ